MSKVISPNRSELLKFKNKIKMASGGHKLLKKKKRWINFRFFSIIEKCKRFKIRNDRIIFKSK